MKPRMIVGCVLIAIVFLISSTLPFLAIDVQVGFQTEFDRFDPSSDSQRTHTLSVTLTVSPTISTVIAMTDGIQNHTMINVTADGYVTQAFPAQTNITNIFLSHINFTITVSVEKYYQFQLWTGDLGPATNSSRAMMKIGDKVVGNKQFDSIASGNATSFLGYDQHIIAGEIRILPGTYTLQLINMINMTSPHYQESENYIGILIIPQSRPLYSLEFSFAVVADMHFGTGHTQVNVSGGVDGNTYMGWYDEEVNYAWVNQINNMNPKPAFVVIPGDLMSGIVSNVVDLRTLLDTLTVPYYLIDGNHDKIDWAGGFVPALFGNFSDLYPEWTASHFYYYRDIGSARFIFLDSQEGSLSHNISATQQIWLNATLNTNRPVFLFQHEPLIDGSWDKLGNAADIAAILQAHSNVVADFAAHGHNEWIHAVDHVLYVETPAVIQYPVFYTVVDYYQGDDSGFYAGAAIDVNRYQVNWQNLSRFLQQSCVMENTSLGIGDTAFVQYIGFGPIHLTQVSILVDLTFVMFAVGIVVGVIAGGTHSLRRKEMLTTQEMMRSLLNMVIYIIIGMASLGVIYSIVA